MCVYAALVRTKVCVKNAAANILKKTLHVEFTNSRENGFFLKCT